MRGRPPHAVGAGPGADARSRGPRAGLPAPDGPRDPGRVRGRRGALRRSGRQRARLRGFPSGGHGGISAVNLPARGLFPDPKPAGEDFNRFIDDVHDEPGGLFVVNHPTEGEGIEPAWTRDGFDWSGVDAMEIWNIHWAWRDDVVRGLTDASNNDEALELWTRLLDRGHRIAALGGSDSHWLATSGIQGPGQPTTWVFAEEATVPAILQAVREGRTVVSESPTGPRITLEGGASGPWTAIPGDTLPTDRPVRFRVEVDTGQADRIRLVSCRGVEAETAPGAHRMTWTTRFQTDCWVRADLLDVDDELGPEHLLYRAVTSPIYVR